MSINLSIQFNHPAAIANRVQYARIDNTNNPNFITVSPDPVTSPTTIASNIANGQYRIESTPIYADGRSCDPTVVETDPCPGLISITAVIQGSNIVVSYLAPSSVPKVRITVNYPNGGSFVANYVNNGNDIPIPLPDGLDGNFTVLGQSVCDEDSGFYSAFSNQVVVTRITDNVRVASSAAGIVITVISGVTGFTLSQTVAPGDVVTGTHSAFFNVISFTWTGTPALSLNAVLSLNGTPVQCLNIPNTNGGSLSFNSLSVAANDQLNIDFSTGSCP